MDPEVYRDKYLEPFGGTLKAPASPTLDELFYPEESSYYSDSELSPYMYNFTIDNLTREELMRLIEATGFGDPTGRKTSSLLDWLAERERISDTRRVLLIDREERLATLEHDRATLLQRPSYRLYCALMLPLRGVRRIWRILKPGS